MKPRLAIVAAAVLFTLLATANSGGYRFGISDQAFYEPAIALSATPALFPRDRVVLASQMRLWLGDSLLGWLARFTGGDLPALFVVVYVVTLLAVFAAGIAFARSLGADWWTIAVFLALLTLRHRIAKTGANSLEGYMHPRMLAFAFGLASFSAIARGRTGVAVAWTTAAAVIHTTVALWFGAVVVLAAISTLPPRRAWLLLAGGAVAAGLVAVTVEPLASRLTTMDASWIAALGDKDYLFPIDWPLYAWVLNLGYPMVLLVVYRRRRALGQATDGEQALVAGLMGLVAIFLVSVPLTAMRLALAVQLQVTRVFWLLDAAVMFYLAWWLMADLARRWPAGRRQVLVAALVAVSAARGYYIVQVDADRRLVEIRLPVNAWTDVMSWLRTQPVSWHVLADPLHTVHFGESVRVAAERDTLLELNKDSALAMYDRDVALRLAERNQATLRFNVFTEADLKALSRTYELDVLVDRDVRRFAFPILYRNDQFIVYDLR